MEHLMSPPERDRRLIPRHDIRMPLRIRRYKAAGPEESAESLNLSEYGVFFTTNAPLQMGLAVEVVVCMPAEVSGQESDVWHCIGRVVRVEQAESGAGTLSVAVRFDCYEVARAEQRRMARDAKLRQRVTPQTAP